ncbi:MAG: Ig-like domain-containing protein [Treponema sp.]|nr:Ig-like domain-containing protein [Treponema sp.]
MALVLMSVGILSCKVGLGPAVDVEAPTLEITYPPMQSVIRGSFVLAGTCDDDRTVDSIQITVTNADTKIQVDSFTIDSANIDFENKTWKVEVNPFDIANESYFNGYKYADGTYTFGAIANDASEHSSGEFSRTLIIDNTAPVLLLSSPLKYGYKEDVENAQRETVTQSIPATTYGRTFKIAGDISDDNTVESMKVVMRPFDSTQGTYGEYKDLSTEITFTETSIGQMSADNPLVIASYYSSAEIANETDSSIAANYKNLRRKYLSLYNHTQYSDTTDTSAETYDISGGTSQEYYLTFLLYDNAREFKDVSNSSGSGAGNVSSVYYINTDDFYDQLMTTETYSLTAKKIKDIVNGTSSVYTGVQIRSIKTILEKYQIECKESLLGDLTKNFSKISVNPDSDPHYTISGFETGKDTDGNFINSSSNYTDGFKQITSGSTITINFAAGLDKSLLKPNTIGIYLYKLGNNSETDYKTLGEGNKATLCAPGSWTDDAAASLDETFNISTDSEISELKSLISGAVGNYFRIVVEGEDRAGNPLSPASSGGYGFLFTTASNPPEVTITNAEDKIHSGTYIKSLTTSNDKLDTYTAAYELKGTVKFDGVNYKKDNDIFDKSSVKVELTVINSSTGKDITSDLSEKPFTVDFSKSDFNDDENHSFSIKLRDIKVPSLGGKFKYTFKVTITDENGKSGSARYSFTVDTQTPTVKINTLSSNYAKDVLHITGSVSDSGAGVGDVSYSIYDESDNLIQFYPCTAYNASSKTPTLENSTVTRKSLGAVESVDFYLWLEGSNNTTFADKKQFYVKLTASDATEDQNGTITLSNENNASSSVITVDKTAPSIVYDPENSNSHKEMIGSFGYNADTSDYWFNNTSVSFSGYLKEEGCGVDAIYYQSKRDGDGKTPMDKNNYLSVKDGTLGTSAADTGFESYSGNISIGEGTNTVTFVYVDKLGNVSEPVSRIVKMDKTAPKVTDSYTDSSRGAEDLSFDIKVTDEGGSGLAAVTGVIGGKPVEVSVYDGKEDYTHTVKISKETLKSLSGTLSAIITASDTAGNSSTPTGIATITIDKTAPSIKISAPAANSVVNKTIEISGTAADPSGVDSVTVKIGDHSYKATVTDASSTGEKEFSDVNWTVNVDTTVISNTDSDVLATIKVIAKDKLGNETLESSAVRKDIKINQSGDNPVITIKNLTKSETTKSYYLISTSCSISGTISDDDSTESSIVEHLIVSPYKIISYDSATGKAKYVDGTEKEAKFTYSNGEYTTTTEGFGVTEFNSKSSAWTYVPANTEDGEKNLYFFVMDNAGASFNSGASGSLSQPKVGVQDISESAFSTEKFTLIYDGTKPEFTADGKKIHFVSDTNGTAYTTGDYVNPITITQQPVGGSGTSEKKFAKFVISATDASGIKGMAADIGSKKYRTGDFNEADYESYTTGGNFTASTTADKTTWTTPVIDFTSADFETGNIDIIFYIYDQAGKSNQYSTQIPVDKTGPAIKVSSPKTTVEASGSSVTVTGTTIDNGGSDSKTIEWLIPTLAQQKMNNSNLLELNTWSSNGFNDSASVSNWEFEFSGTNSFSTKTSTTPNTGYATATSTEGVFKIPVYFKATDTLGNETILRDYYVLYNSEADKPSAAITYPTDADYDTTSNGSKSDFVTLGGTIRVTGSVNIPDNSTTPAAVFMQIATVDDDSDTPDWGVASKKKVTDAVAKVDGKLTNESGYGYTAVDSTEGVLNLVKTINDSVTKLSGSSTTQNGELNSDWWGINVSNSTSSTWSFSLNAEGSMDPVAEGTTRKVWIRVCGVSAEGKIGNWSTPYLIHVDDSAPTYSAKLYQYSVEPDQSITNTVYTTNLSSAKPTAEREYSSGMYLKGNWYLALEIEDETGILIDSVKNGSTALNIANSEYYMTTVSKESSGDGKAHAKIYIPVSTVTDSVIYKITAHDIEANQHSIYPEYNLNVDNKAPDIDSLTSDEKAVSMTKLRNSNYVTSFGGKVTDTGSGVDMVAYYFKRGNKIELPLPKYDSNTKKWSSASSAAYSKELDTTDANELPAVNLTGGSTGNSELENGVYYTTYTNSDIASYKFIRVGSLIYIGGSYYVITEKPTSTSVKFAANITTNYTSASFPAAIVVDNAGESSWSSQTGLIDGDDGDGIVESGKLSGTTYIWSTSVFADELDDGEIEIVTVSFDNAGNVGKKSTTVMLANNTPRLANVFIASDLNGDGVFTDNELGQSVYSSSGKKELKSSFNALSDGAVQDVVTVSGYDTTTSNTSIANLTEDTGITMRDTLGIALEFVDGFEGYGSGVGTKYYNMQVGASKVTSPLEGSTSAADKTKLNTFAAENKFDTTQDTTTASLSGLDKLVISKSDFYKSTKYGTYKEYLTSGETGYSEGESYKNYITLTIWDSTNDKAGTKDVLAAGSTTKYESFGAQYTVLNIPLKMDFVDGLFPVPEIDEPTAHTDGGHVDLSSTLPSNYFSGSEGYLDKDTKVSGKVVFTGTVKDETRVNSISLTTSNQFSSTPISSKKVAAYNTTGQNKGKFTITQPAEGLTFEITKNEFTTTEGHEVGWSLTVDTSKVSGVAAADVTFTVSASDGTNNNNDSGAKVKPATKKVDIVPYITGITRSKTEKSNTTMNRSTYGQFPVAVGDTLTVSGYNFASGQTTKIGNSELNEEVTGNSSFTIEGFTNSGELTVKVNGIESLNDKNNNACATNKDKDGKFDNRYIRVWDVGHYFSNSVGTDKPTLLADASGNLFSAWTIEGTNMALMQKNIKTKTVKAVWSSYDPAHDKLGLSVDKSVTSNGDIALILSAAHVGSSGKGAVNCYSDLNAVGGIMGIGIPNDLTNVSNDLSNALTTIKIAGNPYTIMDKVHSAGFQLSSYAFRRNTSDFKEAYPHSARYKNNMHFVYYDKINKALRYTYQPIVTGAENTENQYQRTISGWHLIDGAVTDGQDRIHTNDKIGVGISSVTETSVEFTDKQTVENGYTIAVSYESKTGEHKVKLFTATADSNGTTATVSQTDVSDINKVSGAGGGAIYKGLSNVVTGGVTNTSAGSYNSIDVTTKGKPVIVYYANGLRIAYSSSSTPKMSSSGEDGVGSWSRQEISGVEGGTYVQCKIDKDNYLHIIYRNENGDLCYLKSTNKGPEESTPANYSFGDPELISSSSSGGTTYGTLSLIREGSGTDDNPYVYIPCVAFLNSEGTANGIKYAIRCSINKSDELTEDEWDVEIIPAVVESSVTHYVSGGHLIYVEGNPGTWNSADTIDTSKCDSIVGFNSGRMDVVFLKSEQ